MLILNKMGLALGGAVLLAGCVTSHPDQETQAQPDALATAWWVKTEFIPSSTSILGMPLTRFRPDWVKAQRLHKDYMETQISGAEHEALINSKLTFDLKHSLDDDPEQERFIVGVYESSSGDKGRFMAVLEDESVVKVFEYPGLAGYSALLLMDGGVYWYKCMECDDFDTLEWTGSDYRLQ